MSLLDDVSIVVTPNGYKAGELYAVIPSDGASDMDVTRATAATRVDENGLVNYAEIIGGEEVTNGDFANGETGWSFGTNWEVVSEQATTTGVTLTPISQSVLVNGTNRLTFDIISGGALIYTNYPSFSVKANLTTTGTHTIDLESDGVGTNQLLYIYNRYAGNSSTIDNISVKEVTRDNVPRIDYTGGGCPHILAEPQRTNLVTYSNDFTDSSWSKNKVTINDDFAISPDGTLNASNWVSIGGSYPQMTNTFNGLTIGEKYTISFYVKSDGTTQILQSTWFTGFTATTFTPTSEWTRITNTITATATTHKMLIFTNSSGAAASSFLLWGAQVEDGSYATSYIPTSGSTVTRNQDIFTRDGIGSLINSTEGVLFLEVAALSLLSDVSRVIMLTSSDGLNYVNIYFQSDGRLTVYNNVNGVNTVLFQQVLNDITLFNKCALKWGSQGYELWVNGIKLESSTSTSVPIGLSEINFNWNGGIRHFYGKVKQLQVYKTALTDVQLAALTS